MDESYDTDEKTMNAVHPLMVHSETFLLPTILHELK